MRSRRIVGRFTAAAALAGAGVLGFAAPAGAAGGDTVMIDNAPSLTIYSGQSLTLASVAKATCKVGLTNRSVSLTLAGPTGPAPSTQTVKSDHVPCNRDASLTTSIRSPELNGAYVVTLENSTAGNLTTATLDVLIPPDRAEGFSVATAGTVATFSWSPNPEPDVVAYDILNSSGAVASSPSSSDACGGGTTCSTSLDLGPSAAGRTEKFSVRAVRCGLSCSDSTVPGASSPPASATFAATPSTPAPSPSSPTTSPGHGHGTGGGGSGNGGASGGGSTSGVTGNGGGGSATNSHHAGKAHLPGVTGGHLPSIHVPALPGLHTLTKPLVLGKPGGKIHYPAPQVARTSAARPSTTTSVSHDIATGLKLPPLWRGIAAAAILLLIAMHLRTWVARVDLS